MTREPYGTRLRRLLSERGPLCVGIDPHPELLRAWDLPADAGGLERFARRCVEAFGDLVAVVKPQSAFFETYGSAGIAVLERVLADLRDVGASSILDVKRGDIGSTMAAYAAAYLADGAPLAADAITASPYLGFGSLEPALALAERTGRGVYVLALTSNPEGASVQQARSADGTSIGQQIIDAAIARNAGTGAPAGHVGLVVGATTAPGRADLSRVNGPVLAPGLGAQGATAGDLAAVFGPALAHVLPAISREVLGHGPDPRRLREAARRAAGQMIETLPVG